MGPPFFPLTPKQLRADITYRDFRPPEVLKPHSDVAVRTARLNHPNGAVGYRIDFAGRSACYVTDTEHRHGERDSALVELIEGANLMIYDCMYTDDEFDRCQGYGHSTWEEGVRLCEAAGVARLVIFHHRPGRDDERLKAIESEAVARFPGSVIARSGLVIEL